MLVVITNGFIIDAYGPYPASDPDFRIFTDIMSTEISSIFKENDAFSSIGVSSIREILLSKKNIATNTIVQTDTRSSELFRGEQIPYGYQCKIHRKNHLWSTEDKDRKVYSSSA